MEFQDVVRKRRMVRKYDMERAVPAEAVEQILHNAVRAPTAGFSQGWGFLVLDNPEDIARFRTAGTPEDEPENWFSATFEAPLVIVTHSNKSAYLDRYAKADKGKTDRSEAWWPAPYWDIDTGMAALLILQTAVDLGLGACFFGLPVERIPAYREAFGVPEEFHPIGAVTIGYPAEPPRDLSKRRKATDDVIRRGRWTS
ncbi:nitroreductase family protein [Kribbella sp. NBC_01245]|uniref:nitroreductase family protein n=1 Tax=Kribbella sp. NBC_01245 TaxID=2903578 RepID=UPI002E28DA9B|nr:nitroreductase family protein [Kribbella sp. NBC_01245]